MENKRKERSYSGEERSYGERPRRNFSNNQEGKSFGERKTYGDRPRRPRIGDSEFRTYGERPRRFFGEGQENKAYGERKSYGERSGRNFSDNQERKSFGERKTYGDRPRRSRIGDSEGRTYGDRPRRSFGEGQEGKAYGERRSYSDRPRRPRIGDSEGRTYGDRPRRSFGGRGTGSRKFDKRSYGNQDFTHFKHEDESGIGKMINRRPLVEDYRNSDNDFVLPPIKEEVRLNKFIANSGICSRREADDLILAGVVTVNGEVVTELGTKINSVTDDVRFNGERLKGEEKVYIVMNKPKGYVTTTSDPNAEKTVMDLLKKCKSRVFPVGRLDKNTTGVLMFTNDGEIAEKLTHPSYDKKKIYQVSLDSQLKKEDYDKIMEGVELSDGVIKVDALEYIEEDDHRKIGIEIHSGKNRIVRRIFEALGYEVRALDRVYFAGLTKKGLKRGEWRMLTTGETNILRMGAYN